MEPRHEYQVAYRQKNKEKFRAYQREYRANNSERIGAYDLTEKHKNHRKLWWLLKGKEYCVSRSQKLRLKAMQIVSGMANPICVNCGCSDFRVLEINHKNLGGRKENLRGRLLYDAIISGKRKVEDLEVLCRVCNAAHYLEKKFNIGFNIKFIGLGLSEKERRVSRVEIFGENPERIARD